MGGPLEVRKPVLARIERSLTPDGVLFLGHAETLRGLSEAFSLQESSGAFFYRRKPAPTPAPAPTE